MTLFWRTESCCYISRGRATQNFVVYCANGTASIDFTLQEEGLVFLTIRRGGSKAPTIGRTQRHFSAPLRIKLGIMKNSVKAMEQTGTVFRYLTEKFSGIRTANIKEGVLWSTDPQALQRQAVQPNCQL
jgi:hypothetical protein